MTYVIKILEKELKKLEENKPHDYNFNQIRINRINSIKEAIQILNNTR